MLRARAAAAVTPLICAAAWGVAAGPAHAAGPTPVSGSWQQLVNCAFTSYDPLSGAMACAGSSHWRGTWTGLTVYHAQGNYDLISGDSTGQLTETFRGRDTDGRRGTLVFHETYLLVGSTSTIHITTQIVRATGGFTGARGHATFDGTDNIATGFGNYSGTWTPPPHPIPRPPSGRAS